MSSAPVNITIISGEGPKNYTVRPDESLLSVLRADGCFVPSDCGGKGFCGKCKVRVSKNAPVSDLDRRFLKESQINTGIRLACALKPYENLVVYAEKEDNLVSADDYNENITAGTDEIYLALDIGTTTVALKLINPGGENVGAAVFNNPQRSFGADVVSRITACTEGKEKELQKAITEKISLESNNLLEKYGIKENQIKKCAIACNTTMGHILMNYDCSGLGVYPFKTENIDTVKFPFNEIFTGSKITAETVLFPGISAYVGGDIVSGIYNTEIYKSDELCLLIDLGTNGEMALGNKNKILTASAAAGPAFEGGNISCGTGSVPGAINSVVIAGGRAQCSTVGGCPVTGICGTGVIDITAALIQNGIVDKSGFLDEDYSEYGYPLTRDGKYRFIQDDIRQVQLAKSAVRAGIETLMERYPCKAEDISKIYISGGFSRAVNIKNAVIIGLIPKEFKDQTRCIGNSSLEGAVKYLTSAKGDEELEKVKNISSENVLSTDDIFNEKFMDYITF